MKASWHPSVPGLNCSPGSEGLTQSQQDGGHLGQLPARHQRAGLGFAPAHTRSDQPGVDVVSAQSLGLGHELLVSGRPVKNLHHLRGKD